MKIISLRKYQFDSLFISCTNFLTLSHDKQKTTFLWYADVNFKGNVFYFNYSALALPLILLLGLKKYRQVVGMLLVLTGKVNVGLDTVRFNMVSCSVHHPNVAKPYAAYFSTAITYAEK